MGSELRGDRGWEAPAGPSARTGGCWVFVAVLMWGWVTPMSQWGHLLSRPGLSFLLVVVGDLGHFCLES